jgi:uncharacterized protein with HEPN domain
MPRRPHALRLPDYLQHIVEAVERVRTYTDQITRDSFLSSPMIQDAVIRNLEVIGEACRNVLRHHGEFVALHPEIPWHKPYGMRNSLSHGYFNIDLIQVWDTAITDLPPLAAQIRDLLDQMTAPPT